MKSGNDQSSQHGSPHTAAGPQRPGSRLAAMFHYLIVLGVLGVVSVLAVNYFRASSELPPPPKPATMEEVDWTAPNAGEYCLACHRPVGPAMAGLDIEHGHPLNVALNDVQRAAIERLGTVTGPDNTLVCMSCHVLRENPPPYMLADTLTGGQFCEHCHPGHYARGTPHDLRLSAPEETNRLGQTAAEGGPCSACHLAHRYARDFETCEHDPDGRCTTCHQVHECAEGHARPFMEHPESRCLECHDPHEMRHGEFLKAPVDTLCIECHEGYAGGVPAGMHPVKQMDEPIPQALLEAGAWVADQPQQVTCTVCHDIHEANTRPLLVMGKEENQLCLACHMEKLGETMPGGQVRSHGQQPVLSADQRAVVKAWETPVGPNGELLCVTCHKVHGSHSQDSMVAFGAMFDDTCSACHPDQRSVLGTTHDLRTNHPDEENVLGMNPVEHGACSACHLAHGYARELVVTAGDVTGECVSCHRENACASAYPVEGAAHPDTRCADCHDPHTRRHDNYLAKAEPELCSECHEVQAKLVGGPHDMRENPAVWPAAAAESGGLCLSCHVAHGGERPDLFRVRGEEPVGNHDDVCLVCHADAAWGADTTIAAIHPQQISPEQEKVELALVPTDEAGNMRMGCRTCHNAHGPSDPRHLARVTEDQPGERLCLHCHERKHLIKYTGHSSDRLMRLGFDVDSCKPCHAMHARPGGTWGQMLSPRFLLESELTVPQNVGGRLPCLACHHEEGPAPIPPIYVHPEVAMVNTTPPEAQGYLPLFDAEGHIDPNGQVVCRTCHLSHGRLDLLESMAAREELSESERVAVRAQLRPFDAPNVCTDCHGLTARARFLWFHDPDRRPFPQ